MSNSNDNSQNFYESARPWAVFYKQAKNNMEDINSTLMKQLDNYEKENAKLKEALSEIHNDSKEKDEALDESHKIITKLNDEYTKLMKEFRTIEQYASEIETENVKNKKMMEEMTKSHSLYEKLQKQNSTQKSELEQFKKENQNMKKEFQNKLNDISKIEKENKDKNNIINELKKNIINYESITEEREKSFQEMEFRLNELNSAYTTKEEELKEMLKLNQEIGNENKSNVEEMTKQAINTIKLFYNTLNNNKGRITITNPSNLNNEIPFLSKTEVEKMIKENKISFLLEDALTYKDESLERGSVPREYLQNMQMKFELLKTELFASLMREMNIVKHLDKIIPKNEYVLLENSSNEQNGSKPRNLIDMIIAYFDKQKNQLEDFEKEMTKLKKEYNRLSEQKKDLDLYILKVKENSKNSLNRMKDKFEKTEKILTNHLALKRENANILENINTLNKNLLVVTKDLKTAYTEINSLKDANQNLQNSLKESDLKFNENHDYHLNLQDNFNKILEEKDYYKFELERIKDINLYYEVTREDDFYINSLYKSKVNNRDIFNMSMQSMESSNDRSFVNKKEENIKLKDEIERLKDEISNLIRSNAINEHKIREFKDIATFDTKSLKINKNINLDYISETEERMMYSDMKNQNESTQKIMSDNKYENCQNCYNFSENCNDFKVNILRPTNFKELKQYYVSYQMDMNKIHTKIEEIVVKFSLIENQFANENQDKKIKISQVREIISQLHKLISVFSVFINKYNKDIYHHSTNLKKLFDFVTKMIYSNNFLNSFSSMMSSKSPIKLNRLMPVDNILKMIYDMNNKVFNSSECNKIYVIYENKNILEVIDLFKLNCDMIKSNLIDKLECDTEFSDYEDNNIKLNQRKDNLIKSSYKVVNERILKLKKFEFDFDNLVEIVKNYLIAQEIIIRNLFQEVSFNRLSQDMISSDAFKNLEYQKSRLDIIDKLIYIAEDALFYKCNESAGDLMFMRKVTLRLLKNQKFYLELALDMN